MCFFRFMAHWGIWGMMGFVGGLIPTLAVLFYLFPRKAIKNFYISTFRAAANPPYSKVMVIEMRNLTNAPLYVLSEGFRFGNVIHASPHAAINVATQICEAKFPGPPFPPGDLTEIDTLVRHNQPVSTWVPIDPNHTDDEIDAAIQNRSVGVLHLKCLRLSSRRQALITLRIRL
jgi:hypothetical protein